MGNRTDGNSAGRKLCGAYAAIASRASLAHRSGDTYAILRESGEQVYAQPAAAADSSEGFYPQRYVPGAVSLNLQPNVPEGSYTLVITMADKVGGQTAEARREFHIQK